MIAEVSHVFRTLGLGKGPEVQRDLRRIEDLGEHPEGAERASVEYRTALFDRFYTVTYFNKSGKRIFRVRTIKRSDLSVH